MEVRKDKNATFGERLRGLRKTTNRTLKEESEIFEVSLNSVFRWENNMTMPRRAMVRKIAGFYNVDYDWLLHGAPADKSVVRIEPDGIESSTEKQLLRMFKNLSYDSKFKVLGYVERICVEDLGGRLGAKHLENLYFDAEDSR